MSGNRVARLWVLCWMLLGVAPLLLSQTTRTTSTDTDESAERDHPAEREKWFMQGRVAPKGKTPAEMRWQAYQQKIQMRAARMVAARQAGAAGKTGAGLASTGWKALGPAPLDSSAGTSFDFGLVSGRATSVAADPADATGNTAYVGGAFGGVWRSRNAGDLSPTPSSVSWAAMIDAQPTLSVGAIALQPCSATLLNCDSVNHLSKTILIGTGEPNSAIDSYYGLGILRSVDAGNNWTLISSANAGGHSFKGLGFSRFAFNTSAGKENVVVAAAASAPIGTEDGARASGQITGPFVSTDSGATWNAATSITDGTFGGAVAPVSVSDVAFNAKAGAAGTFYMALKFHGIYSSTDGSTWTRLAAQPAPAGVGINSAATCPTAGNTACPMSRGEIAVVPGRNEMYVWYTDRNDADQLIWRSVDGGASWIHLDNTNITTCGDPGGCGTNQAFYDLELAAVPVPNGSSTDLYAGARNLFKCTISGTVTTSTCSGSGTTSFQNLAHVYNCPGHATVHPDQHGIAFLLAGAKDVMYFANDGGVNRALDGFTGLVTSNCQTNQFDDLNGTLGSMTQFVSFSQDPGNSAVVLGGTQDNGSPSTSQTNTNWRTANDGDGGYNEIDPVNPNNWYTANTDVSIQRCTSGSACTVSSFQPVVSPGQVGSDSSAFYTPYMLDPQNSNALLVGTCRVWRGSSTGTGFVAISPNFDAGFATICADPQTSTTPINYVHALAAGGPVGSNGFSKVVYAGLAGFGPLSIAPPVGGRVFVTSDSSASSIAWSEITPPANQSTFYTIGDIAVDPSDATGSTTFVGLEGFNTSHILKTTNSNLGLNTTWTDFSGGLPNAPVDSLIIDSSAGIIYAGTDVGVFSSPTSTPNWTEVGPAPAPGAVGYLPDAPVTKLRLFSKNGTKILRASTYGRGIWEFQLAVGPPSFQVGAAPTTITAYAGQPATFNATLTSINGYAGTVTISCGSGAPATCTPPSPITLAADAIANFSVTASSVLANTFTFNIHGTDGTLNSDQPVILNVVDFAIGAPNPAAVTANVPNASNATTIQVTAAGSFNDTVTLTCSGLPAGAMCNFSPSASVQPTSAVPATVNLTIGTIATTPVGASTITITAHDAANPEPTAKAQSLSLTVTANPDYTLAISNPTPTKITVQGQQPFNGTLTSFNGYNQPVTISCAAGTTAPPATCLVTTSPTTPTAGGANFTVLTSNTAAAGTFNFIIHTTDGTLTHDMPVTLVLDPDFRIVNTTTTQTVTAGGTATFTPLTFNPDGAATLVNATSYSCSGLPSLSTCTFSPASIPAGSGSADVTLSIHTTAAVASGTSPSLPWKPSGPLFAFWLSLPALGIVSITSRRQSRKPLAILGSLLVLGFVASFAGCGGGSSSHQGQPGTPPGPYTITVTAKAASPGIAQQTTTVKLVVQ